MRDAPTHLPLTRRELLMAGAASAASAAAPDVIAQPAAGPVSMAKVSLEVNGQVHALALDTRTTLLDALREQLHLTGSKKGCDQGQCGACTVIVDGRRVTSCLTLAVMQQATGSRRSRAWERPGACHGWRALRLGVDNLSRN